MAGGAPPLTSFSMELRLFSSFVRCPPHVALSSPDLPDQCLGGLPSPFVWCKPLTAPSRGISIPSAGPREWCSSASRAVHKHFAMADKKPPKMGQ